MASPGKWVHVETDAGHILRLVGANGEEIMRSSEVLSDRREVYNEHDIARASMGPLEYVDERTQGDSPQ
jgi:hypothetical protein